MANKPYGSSTKAARPPVKIIAPAPASTVEGALKASQTYLDKAK
jgi:hypothetical protein